MLSYSIFDNGFSFNRENTFLNHFLVYLLMGISSMPILFGNEFLIVAFVLTLIIFIGKQKKIDRTVISYSLVFLALFGLHVIAYDQFIFTVMIAYFVRIYYAFFTVKIVGKNIDRYVINQVYFFSIISLIITGIIYASPGIVDYIYADITPMFDKITLFQPNRQHFVIYTMEIGWQVEVPRNSGPFWEPGGFAVFLFIALTFNIVRNKKFWNTKNVIFLITLLTTQSTTAYLALFLFLILYVLIRYRSVYAYLSLPVFIMLFLSLYTKLEFMEEKINKMYSDTQKADKEKVYSRMMSGQVNIESFKSSPIFGIGRFFYMDDEENTGNNGTTLLLAEFGLVGFLYYFVMMYSSYKTYCVSRGSSKYYPIAVIVGIIVLGYSQGLFQKPFFIGLTFMFLVKFDALYYTEKKLVVKSSTLAKKSLAYPN